jgi:hypothetical protein
MTRYRQDEFVKVDDGVIDGCRLAVVTAILTPRAARAATADDAISYRVTTDTGVSADLTGADLTGSADHQPKYRTAENFLSTYNEALNAEGDEAFFTMPRRIQHPGTGAYTDVYTATPTLLYRGDDRFGDEVFRDGFTTRAECMAPSFKTRQGDVDAKTGSCAARRPEVGALFPLVDDGKRGAVDPVRLYVLLATGIYQTDVVQKAVLGYPGALTGHQGNVGGRLALNQWAGEVIVPGTLAGNQVLGYYRVYRKWQGKAYNEGMEFEIDGKFVANSGCTVATATRTSMLGKAEKAIEAYAGVTWFIGIKETVADGAVERAWKVEKVAKKA